MLDEYAARRFQAVAAAGRFLVQLDPVEPVRVRQFLDAFSRELEACCLYSQDVEFILLRCLRVLQRRFAGSRAALCETYLQAEDTVADPIERFRRCVQLAIAMRQFSSREMQMIAAFVECHLTQTLTAECIAIGLDLSPSIVRSSVFDQTGKTVSEFIRDLRLDHAVEALRRGTGRIKEVWTRVGYNDASNFDHDFKRRFGTTPSEYRRLLIGSIDWRTPDGSSARELPEQNAPHLRGTLLIADDDVGMRETLQRYFLSLGLTVIVAESGEAAVHASNSVSITAGLIDYHLPDMDGVACVRRLLDRQAQLASRLVLFTADYTVESRKKEIRALGVPLLSKLCDLSDLERTIRHAVEDQAPRWHLI